MPWAKRARYGQMDGEFITLIYKQFNHIFLKNHYPSIRFYNKLTWKEYWNSTTKMFVPLFWSKMNCRCKVWCQWRHVGKLFYVVTSSNFSVRKSEKRSHNIEPFLWHDIFGVQFSCTSNWCIANICCLCNIWRILMVTILLPNYDDKRLCYRRWTARCDVSVEFLPVYVQLVRRVQRKSK